MFCLLILYDEVKKRLYRSSKSIMLGATRGRSHFTLGYKNFLLQVPIYDEVQKFDANLNAFNNQRLAGVCFPVQLLAATFIMENVNFQIVICGTLCQPKPMRKYKMIGRLLTRIDYFQVTLSSTSDKKEGEVHLPRTW